MPRDHRYRGRFAPSPTGPLHAGSLVAALASWLDARAQGGAWLVRIEDVDTTRCLPGLGEHILWQLARCSLVPDAAPLWQSQRVAAYQAALAQLRSAGLAYPCACTRADLDRAAQAQGAAHSRHAERIYPGTCRHGLQGRSARAWRFNSPDTALHWHDRRLGAQQQNPAQAVGDFVVLRADGCFAYQLAVVVDDAAQGISHVVRGQDLCDNTARQIALQQALGLPTPHYLHTPLVLAADGQKLSKQNGATALDLASDPAARQCLAQAAACLGLAPRAASDNMHHALAHWTAQWRSHYP